MASFNRVAQRCSIRSATAEVPRGIARARYREGLSDFLSLLDAERTQLQAEEGAAQAEADVFTAMVELYRAVGGMQ